MVKYKRRKFNNETKKKSTVVNDVPHLRVIIGWFAGWFPHSNWMKSLLQQPEP